MTTPCTTSGRLAQWEVASPPASRFGSVCVGMCVRACGYMCACVCVSVRVYIYSLICFVLFQKDQGVPSQIYYIGR